MDRKSVLRFFVECIVVAGMGAGLAAGYLWLAYERDPLHLFHAPASSPCYMNSNMFIQAAGIINTFEFDSLILGTSVLQNSSAVNMGRAVGGTFANISMSGANFRERSVVARYALESRRLSKVVYSLDRFYQDCREDFSYPFRNWGYLYDGNRMNDLKAYVSSSYFKDIVLGLPVGRKATADKPAEWMSKPSHRCRFGGLQNWVGNLDKQGMDTFILRTLPAAAAKADPQAELVRRAGREAKAAAYVDKYVLSLAEQYRDTEFLLVFPPYWRYDFASMRQTDPVSFTLHQSVVRHVVRRAAELGNVRIFGFEDCSFVDDIANYKDVTHYSEEINEFMAECMGRGEHELSPGNVEAYLARCEELARKFDIKALHREAQSLLDEKQK